MADKKISQLTAATTPLAGTEVLPIVQSGSTVKVSVDNLTTGKSISVTSLTATTGSVIIGTSGQGIDFSATANGSGTTTSELFADYEEGTWTGTIRGATTDPTTPVTATGIYTKIGRQVTVGIAFNSVNTTGISGNLEISGLPFTVGNQQRAYIGASSASGLCSISNPRTMAENAGTKLQFVNGSSFVGSIVTAGGFLWCSNTYFV